MSAPVFLCADCSEVSLDESKLLDHAEKMNHSVKSYADLTSELKPLRTCSKCGREAATKDDLEMFCKAAGNYPHFRYNMCKACQREKTRAWKQRRAQKD